MRQRFPNPSWWQRQCVIPMRRLITPNTPERCKEQQRELRKARWKKWWMQFPLVLLSKRSSGTQSPTNVAQAAKWIFDEQVVMSYERIRSRFIARRIRKTLQREALIVRPVDPTNPDYIAMSNLVDEVLLDSDLELLKKLAE